MTRKLFLWVSIITCVQLVAGVIQTATNSGGDVTYCPGDDVILRCHSNSNVFQWSAKTESTTAPPIVFHNGTSEVNWFRRIDMFSISAVYYINQQTSLLMYLNAYSSVNFTCNDNRFNVFIHTEAPSPRNVTAVMFDGQITINWEKPRRDSEVVKHYLVNIMNGDNPYEVNGTNYVFSVVLFNPRIVSVMTVDVCGNRSIGVDAEVIDLGNTTPVLTTSSCTTYIPVIVVMAIVLILVLIAMIAAVISAIYYAPYCCPQSKNKGTKTAKM